MPNILQNVAGMGSMTEQVVASDMLIAAKSGIKNYALALSETATPQVRSVLKRHLEDAISMHEKVTNFMLSKGYYPAYDPQQLIKNDLQAINTVLNLQ